MHRKLNEFPKIEHNFSLIWKSDSLPCIFQNENVELLTTDARTTKYVIRIPQVPMLVLLNQIKFTI